MKKIIGLLVIVMFTFLISACGPNSDYYNVGTRTYYYYINDDFIIDPYEVFRENSSWTGIKNQFIRKYPEEYYDVKVEYRKNGTKNNYVEMELDKNSMIRFIDTSEFGKNDSYEFKLHFIDKETNDEKTMINYYGIFEFKVSPVYLEKKVINLKVNDTYKFLDNVVEYRGEDRLTSAELASKYKVTYKIDAEEVTEADYTFTEAGTYQITIILETSVSDSSVDGVSDATPGEASDGGETKQMILEINYEIIIKAS